MGIRKLLKNTMGVKNKKELVHITKYFNKTIYEEQIKAKWKVLMNWIIYKVLPFLIVGLTKKIKKLIIYIIL